MAHAITFIKVLTSISATIRKSESIPITLQIGVVINFILSMEAMKVIEPDYIKSIKILSLYWSIYIISIWVYFQTFMVEQLIIFASLFYLIFEIYKENYYFSDSLTEIFLDFHNDPVIIFEDESNIKWNMMFSSYFSSLIKPKKFKHHSQMLTTILNSDEIIFDQIKEGSKPCKISLLEVIRNKKEMDKKELILRKEKGNNIFMFTFYILENIYSSKVVCTFKDITHIHHLQKIKNQSEFKSVIMGWLTHELRTPVNCVTSLLKTLEAYIINTEEARKLLTICQGTIEMLKLLTEDFIDFTRIENNKGLSTVNEPVDIRKLLNEIKDIFIFQAEEKGLSLNMNIIGLDSIELVNGCIYKNIPQFISTDPKRVKQVILNLLSNSFKFTRRGKIEINVYSKKNPVKKEKAQLLK